MLKGKRGIEIWLTVLIVIAVFVFLAITIIVGKFFLEKRAEKLKEKQNEVFCESIKLRIVEISTQDNSITVQRLAGRPEINVISVKVIINDQVVIVISPPGSQRSLKELSAIEYTVDHNIRKGDIIKIAPIILHENNELFCKFTDITEVF